MERLVLFIVTAVIICSTQAAPWVVLDSRSDMLAMSSEISDSEVVVIPPSDSIRGHESVEDDSNSPVTVQQFGTAHKAEENHFQSTTQEPLILEIKPIASATEASLEKDTAKITSDSYHPRVVEKELVESTTATVGAMVESNLKHENMNIPVVPEPPTFPEQHPNSIEEDLSLEPIIIITKRKHSVFNKKQSLGI